LHLNLNPNYLLTQTLHLHLIFDTAADLIMFMCQEEGSSIAGRPLCFYGVF